ncbi:MAG: TlpA disulfide reductase family protein [Verrucomicrobiales bacterium]|nr:TlpA disulfide reductase family protein [Verrucomicrobiales bacterium]
MKTLHTIAALTLATSTAALAGPAEDIISKFEQQKADALTAYLEKTPDAGDRAEALDALIGAYTLLGQDDKLADLSLARYNALPKGKDAELREVAFALKAVIDSYAAAGRKDEAKALIETAKDDIGEHPEAQQFNQFVSQLAGALNKPVIGEPLEIAFTSTQGDEIDLAKMKDKVVLVDFWATWCGPCIAELPHVKKAYADYHDKGFEIVAISLDQEKDELDAFIKKEEMPWPQYFDGKGWQNQIAAKFGIQSIPATFLIGKDGNIVATDLRGEALGEAVAENLGL